MPEVWRSISVLVPVEWFHQGLTLFNILLLAYIIAEMVINLFFAKSVRCLRRKLSLISGKFYRDIWSRILSEELVLNLQKAAFQVLMDCHVFSYLYRRYWVFPLNFPLMNLHKSLHWEQINLGWIFFSRFLQWTISYQLMVWEVMKPLS